MISEKKFTPILERTDEITINPCRECIHFKECNVEPYDAMHSVCKSYEFLKYWVHNYQHVKEFFNDVQEDKIPRFKAKSDFIMEVRGCVFNFAGSKQIQTLELEVRYGSKISLIKATFWGNPIKNTKNGITNYEFPIRTNNIIKGRIEYKRNTFKSGVYQKIPSYVLHYPQIIAKDKWEIKH